SLAIPPGQAVHRECMTNVVEPGTVPSSSVGDLTSPEKLAEGVVDRLTEVRPTHRGGEEGDIGGADAQGVRIAPEVLPSEGIMGTRRSLRSFPSRTTRIPEIRSTSPTRRLTTSPMRGPQP